MKTRLALAFVLFSAMPSIAQETSTQPTVQIEAMKRLAYMPGVWEGEGWIQRGPQRLTFRGREVVQTKLNGLALLVEGNFSGRPPGSDRDVPVHTTLGVISYDAQTRAYRLLSWLATGTSGSATLVVEDRGWRWDISSPQGLIRYSMSLTDSGEWLEVGDFIREGAAPIRFFEMRLKKIS
jgi:hypothetical protein